MTQDHHEPTWTSGQDAINAGMGVDLDPEISDDAALDTVDDDVDADAMRSSSQAGEAPDLDEDVQPESSRAGGHARGQRRLREPAPASLLDILEGRVPTFLVHRGHRHSDKVPELLAVARRAVAGQAGVGAVIRLPRMRPSNARQYLDLCTAATLKVADPEIYALAGSGAPLTYTEKMTAAHPWASSVPSAPEAAWVREVLDAQVAAGANVLLSASGWVPDTDGPAALSQAMDWVRASRTEVADEPMFVNLTLPASWLTTKSLLNALKEELVESTEPLWWLRFYWPVVEPRYGQMRDAAILNGYRELARTAAVEDKVLILPNSGLTGWAATAWGAQGFSTGTSWTEQKYGADLIRRSTPGQPKPPPVERYFDRTILHSLPHADHLTLRGEAKHQSCHCRFCRRLAGAATYLQPVADLHYLLECARLTAQLGGRRPGHAALRAVRDAQAFTAALPTSLTGPSRPMHLPEWESRLP